MIILALMSTIATAEASPATKLCEAGTLPSSLDAACACVTSNKLEWYSAFRDEDTATTTDRLDTLITDEDSCVWTTNTCFDYFNTIGETPFTSLPPGTTSEESTVWRGLHVMAHSFVASPPGEIPSALELFNNASFMGAQCDGIPWHPKWPWLDTTFVMLTGEWMIYDEMTRLAVMPTTPAEVQQAFVTDLDDDEMDDILVLFANGDAWILHGPLGPNAVFQPPVPPPPPPPAP